MVTKIFLLFSILLCQKLYAAGAACFNYETHEHQPPVAAMGANQALTHYDYGLIANRNGVIPILSLVPGVLQIGLSLENTAAPGWNHALLAAGPLLNIQEACFMAIRRESIGITLDFQDLAAIIAVANGGAVTPYVRKALVGGGYFRNPLAAAIYRLTFMPPNFLNPLLPFIPDELILHFHIQKRVSKNLKELSFNATINPTFPGFSIYQSIKDTINLQYAPLGVSPYSATIVSADQLQTE